jgi:hypothetical protein
MSARRPLSFFTSPYKGEVGRAAAGWGRVVAWGFVVSPPLLGQMTPSLTLPLSGGGNASREVDR